MSVPSMDDLVAGYVARRQKIRDIEAEAADRVAPIKKEMELIETAIAKLMDEAGTLSERTPHGTAFKKKWTNVKVGDLEQFLSFARQHNRPDLVKYQADRASVLAHEGPIPGIDIERGYTLVICTSGKRKGVHR